MTSATRFDADYYRKFYGNKQTAVTNQLDMSRRAQLIGAFIRYMDLPVRSMLDAGCGIGLMTEPLKQQFPKARYVGLEASEYLCEHHGWTRGSIVDYKPAAPFDLVVCYDVLQYLNDRDATRAIANFGRLTRGALYFSALTQQDWDFYCDKQRTDRDVNIRDGDWYRERLAHRFFPVGGGLFVRKTIDVQMWELERVHGVGRP